jgi:hypothetical protein
MKKQTAIAMLSYFFSTSLWAQIQPEQVAQMRGLRFRESSLTLKLPVGRKARALCLFN